MSENKRNAWIDSLSEDFHNYLGQRVLEEVECIIPDISGMSRGKAMPAYKFDRDGTFFLPISLFYQTISGEYVDIEIEDQWMEKDVVLSPDMNTARAAPWADDATLQVICDMKTRNGDALDIAPRNVLKRILDMYDAKGWQPQVAPELEFYLTKPNIDPNEPIEPPIGRTGRKGVSRQSYSMVAVDEFGKVIDTIYDYAEDQGLHIETVIQEDGAGQIEINLRYGNPLDLADQVFYFKRTIREAALKNGIFATFMAKPMRDEPGSAMHVHQSILDKSTGKNIFSDDDGNETQAFHHFIGGSQKYLLSVIPLLAPYINSYRRFTTKMSAPTNLEWAKDNRTTGLRIPSSTPEARRVENRIIGMDCNPYLAIAASLAAGYLGLVNKIPCRKAATHEVWESENELPLTLNTALDLFEKDEVIQDILGADFSKVFMAIKRAEYEEYQREISPWERQHLLLNV